MVTKKPKGLGRGLEALLGPKVQEGAGNGEAAGTNAGQPMSMLLADMVPGMYQPRTRMDEGALYELAESIKAQGIMQPILVRKLSEGDNAGKFEIIAGERRFRAARLAGLETVPVLVRDVPNEAAAAMALIENIQREDLNPLEEAQGLQRLIKDFGLTHEQAAQAVFGADEWPSDLPTPQAWLELDVASPQAVADAVAELEAAGQRILTAAHDEPWGQTTARLLSPEGLLVGVTYTPWMHAQS